MARAVFTAGAMAVSTAMGSLPVSAGEVQVLAASREAEVALPGVGAHFVPATPETSLTGGGEVRTGKAGWAIVRLGNETQVELRADSEVVFPKTPRLNETPPAVVEVELRRGALRAQADGGTELRVRFAGGVAAADHARFAVTARRSDPARVIVERGVARVTAGGDAGQVTPAAGQFVEVNQPTTGRLVTAAQPVHTNDADAVAELAALRFVPATVDPAAKSPPASADNSTGDRPLATDNAPANQPGAVPASGFPAALPAAQGVSPLGGFVDVDPLQALANGANIRGPVNSPEHP